MQLNDIIESNREKIKEYHKQLEILSSQMYKLRTDLKKLDENRPLLSYVLPSYRHKYQAQVNEIHQAQEKIQHERDSIIDAENGCLSRWHAAANQISNMKSFIIKHNLPGGNVNVYYTDDYTIEEGVVSFEYNGRQYKILGSITITQNDNPT